MTIVQSHQRVLAAALGEPGRLGVRVTRWRHGDSAREIQARAEVATARPRSSTA